MTENTSSSQEELKLAFDGNSVDWFLQKLVIAANTGSLEFGITLFVEGLIISGQLVSGKKYFSTIGKEFSDAYSEDPETKENLKAAFESNGDIYNHEPDEIVSPPNFIHLINARCYSQDGRSLPNNRGVAWRGKINAVSGFNLGQLEAN